MGNIEIINTELNGVYIIKNQIFADARGTFTKTYNKDLFDKFGICTEFKESYYTISQKDVIRGMHFQKPPYDHNKLIYVPKGKIEDVILDLRKNSTTYKKFISIKLTDINCYSIYIPKGLAHGFKSIEDDTIVVYQVSTVYNPNYDSGIRWDSFGMDWNIDKPIISDRDINLKKLNEFKTVW